MRELYADNGTTWSKILELGNSGLLKGFKKYCISSKNGRNYYIVPSSLVKESGISFTKTTGHMADKSAKKRHVNEIIALSKGAAKYIEPDSTVLDLGSRDAKWVKFVSKKFSDLDWNNSCGSSTGATVEMLLHFYNVKPDELPACDEKYNITCGIFGLEKIMDDIANGEKPQNAIAKFIHGIAFNAWNFTRQPEKIYLSGGFCDNQCFVSSLKKYAQVAALGRFVLCEGLMKD